MRIIWDAKNLNMYPLGKEGFRGGTEIMIERICHGLATRGHTIHLVTRDLEREEQRGDTEFWWPASYHPREADVVVYTQQITPDEDYEADKLVVAHTGCDPYLGPENSWSQGVDAWPVFCETHRDMLLRERPSIPQERVFVTGLGIDLLDYSCAGVDRVPGRLFYANDPMRGLLELLDIYDLLKREVPYVSLHVGYNFDFQHGLHCWNHTYDAQYMLECKQRIEKDPSIVLLPELSREQLVREQLETQVHCMPSNPPNHGTQTWGITQMELAAAGTALVLSDIEAFPEVFGDAAIILPVVGHFFGDQGVRCDAQDYAILIEELMKNGDLWLERSHKSTELAKRNTWGRVVDNWEIMLEELVGRI